MGIKYDYNIVVAVDLDGTLTKKDNFPNTYYEWNPKAIKWIKKIKKLKIILILWTCGTNSILDKKIKELQLMDVYFDYINDYSDIRGNSRKINADFYIDDRGNDGKILWKKIYKKIKKLKKIRIKEYKNYK